MTSINPNILTGATTLQEVADEQEDMYKYHQALASAKSAGTEVPAHIVESSGMGTYKEFYDNNELNSVAFAKEYASELHDLAVIDAHLGGVAINVQQPLSIGEQVKVHKP